MRARRILGGVGAAVIVVVLLAVVWFFLPRQTFADKIEAAGPGAAPGQSGPAAGGSGGSGTSQDEAFGQMNAYLRTRRGSVTAAVEDLRTGRTWTLGDPRPQAEASVVKLDILQALLARSPGGLTAARQALARKMITESDNDAATALWDDADGAAGIGSYNSKAGLSRTKLSACVRCPGFTWPGWGLSQTTPADQLTLLRQLVGPGTLPSAARSYALSLLENVTPGQRWGVTGGVPASATVALKDGWLPLDAAADRWQVNSVGWVSGSGRDYLIAVLSTGNPTMGYGEATISGLSARVWSALGT
jgi:hypothetical protein